MKKMNILKSLKYILLIIVISLISCSKDDNDNPFSNSYVFVEQHSVTSGTLISGPEPPPLMIDFSTYIFKDELSILTGVIDFEISDNLKLVYGSGECLTGTAGGGCGTGLTGVYEIPFERGNFELLKLENNGNIVFTYKDEAHSLKPGEEWISETTRMDTIDFGEELSISEITKIDRITNFGILKKENIEVWEW